MGAGSKPLSALDADEVIAHFDLAPHPEGGYFRETYRDAETQADTGRAHSTAIYYLLKQGQKSHWHRVDAAESWHFYGGAPLRLSLYHESAHAYEPAEEQGGVKRFLLAGAELCLHGDQAGAVEDHITQAMTLPITPQLVIPKGFWQMAEALGPWTLVGCVVAPGFEFSGFELAPPEWHPPLS